MKVISVPVVLPDADIAALEGKQLGESSYVVLVSGTETRVNKPDGSPLLIYRPSVLPDNLCRTTFDVFSKMKVGSWNRGMAAGELDPSEIEVNGLLVGTRTRTRFRALKKDGTESRRNSAQWFPSAIAGFLDRSPDNPYCRQTAFNLDHRPEFNRARPLIRAVDHVFSETLPDRYAKQEEQIHNTPSDFYIRDTAFTTITVNHNGRTAVHQDKGDLKEGFGVMAVLDAGKYEGGYLVFPKYRVAVDMRFGGVCLADVHEYHGNTPIIGRAGTFKRVSLVLYYREGMSECGTAREENLRVRLAKDA